uniref:alpha-2-macroglobulin-like n=1 Tax=Panthera onca TaxID=9690 RepID=UPI002954A4A8|nr:alpha-2-macroglobulin-like [Panthera onca]
MGKNKLLHPNLILLLLIFLPADASVPGKLQYMALVPSLLHTETPEKGCILLSYLDETVTVSASLESLRGNQSLFTDLVVEKDLFHCVSFTVPRSPSNEEVMFLTVQVKGPTQEFKKRTTVVVKNEESLVFVQTDKAIYKPGQTVKFRVVSLDGNFHPLSELIPLVFIQDPKGNRIAQWQKLKLASGLTQLAFPLSSEPIQGSYKVVVQKESGGRTEHPFAVEEFVLPKFEVQVTMPKIITILEEEVNVSVCGLRPSIALAERANRVKKPALPTTAHGPQSPRSHMALETPVPLRSRVGHCELHKEGLEGAEGGGKRETKSSVIGQTEGPCLPFRDGVRDFWLLCFGALQEHYFHYGLCVSLDTGVSEQLSLKLPQNVVEESARASISVLGDILGSAMQNIQNLLRMPYGCGEQNMVLFAPNIYVLNYLNKTQQLTPEVKSKAIGYLNTGYQRQLTYKHHDGSYSTFGEKYGRNEGNTWLTAFVLKTFAQARAYIFIDEAHITQALTWLSQKQKDNGCFRSSGSLLNNAIKGGVEDEVTLSAYITISLLEIPLPATHPVVRNALFCLESAWNSAKEGPHEKHVYTKALLAYAFALVGNQDRSKEILHLLNEEAVKEDNSIHWERPQKPKAPVGHLYQPQAPSAEVEMTSYVLLAHLTAQPGPTSEDLTSAAGIVSWILKQQNAHGGFSSTQDTVVALHALSKYGEATFTGTGKPAQVTIQYSGAVFEKFQVDSDNRLLLQQTSLPKVPGEYTMTVTGEGCVYLQTSLKYNIVPEKEESPFALDVQTVPQTCDGPKAHTSFQISLNVSYTGSRPTTNMVITDVKMISGFIPLKPTVKMLERSNHVSRTEVSNNHVLIYLDKVTNETLSLSFMVLQDIPVRDLKPAIVKVYDYYETDEFAIAEYSAPCSKDHGNA